MAFDTSTLEGIFRMITPADLLGAQKLANGDKTRLNGLRELLDIIYGIGGALDIDRLSSRLEDFGKKVDDEAALAQYRRCIHLYKTGRPCKAFGDSPFIAMASDGVTVSEGVTFSDIVGPNVDLESIDKSMGIVLCNSGFLSPMTRNAERVEQFMNFIPSYVASRMVPLLEVEFAFNRSGHDVGNSQPGLWAPGLMKFLLGSGATPTKGTIDEQLIGAHEVEIRRSAGANGTTGTPDAGQTVKVQSLAGMEMFTSPQTLVNPSPVTGRYVDVIDPFRPLMTIDSFTVNVTPQPGLYSYKKATLVFKLHDRSRLAEIADLVRPQVYQDKGSAPTLWITYGWRHPAEPDNPYSQFINGNMLIREAYGIINSQFSFDQVGQVTVTLNLWTKGLPEMRTLNVNDDGTLAIVRKLEKIAEDVARYRIALGIGPTEGANKEIRGFVLLESAERGTFPDMSSDEIAKALKALKASLTSVDAKLDAAAANALIGELNKLYDPSSRDYLDYKRQLESSATSITNQRFNEAMTGKDPFLPTPAKDEKRAAEAKSEPHPLTSVVSALNQYNAESDVTAGQATTTKAVVGFRKKAVSFGKLFSVFTANTFKQVDGVDELQVYFYQFNDKAGAAAGCNIAEFPIEMPVFMDQYRDHVERKGSERVTLEEFLQIVVDGQLHDTRAIGYGFRQYYAKYDPANKHDAKLAQGVDPEKVELAKRLFKMPAIGVYVETSYSSRGEPDNDLLHQYEAVDPNDVTVRSGRYTRIMKIHVFDKQNSPYKLADAVLQADDSLSFVEVDSAFIRQQVVDKRMDASNVWSTIIKDLDSDGKLDKKGGTLTNQEIKNFVSKMVPTIVYGSNASMITNANLASKQDPLLATTQMQALAKGSGRPHVLQPNGSDVGGLPLRIVPASMTLTSMGCPLLTYAQQFFIDFNTGTTIDNVYLLTGLNHSLSAGKFESQLTLTFYDAYGKFFGAPTITDYVKSMQVPQPKK